MLGKLLKYELKSSGRSFLPLYLLVIVLTPVLALILKLTGDSSTSAALNIAGGFSMFGYVMALIALNVGTFILVIYRFYQSMTKEPAYLTFTLPVSTKSLIASKVIMATMWQILTFALTVASLLGFLSIIGVLDGFSYSTLQCLLVQTLGISEKDSTVILIFLLLSLFVGTILSIIEIFTAISIGQSFREHRLIISVAFYFGIYMIMQILSMIVAIPFSLMQRYGSVDNIHLDAFMFVFLGSILISIVGIIAGFLVSNHMFKKKLNLE